MKIRLTKYQALMSLIESLTYEGIEYNVKTVYNSYPYNNDVYYYEISIYQSIEEE